MVITKVPDYKDTNLQAKIEAMKIATKGCDVCPFCKSEYDGFPTKTVWYGTKNELKSVFSLKCFIPKNNKYWQINHYKCSNCGAEWDSEPYEVL